MSNCSRLKFWTILLFFAFACAGNGCRCDSPNALARLTSASSPDVQLDRVTKENLWLIAPTGSEFFLGDGIRTGASSTAELSLRHNAKLHVEPGSVVRFLSTATDNNVLAIDIEMGDAILETTTNSFKISTRLGAAIIERSSKIRLKGSPQGLEIIVDYGQVSIDNPKVTAPLTAGQHVKLELNIGDLELAPSSSAPMAAASVAPSPNNAVLFARSDGPGAEYEQDNGWSPIPNSTTSIAPNSRLRSKGSIIDLSRGSEHLRLGKGEYRVGLSTGQLVQVEQGEVTLQADSAPTRIAVPAGDLLSRPRTSGTIKASRYTHIDLNIGSIEILPTGGGDGSRTQVTAGQSARLRQEGVEILGRGPTTTDLTANAGDSFTVHDPHPPTAVALLLPSICPDGAVLRVDAKKTSGVATLSVSLAAGTHRYAIHCLSESGPNSDPATSGTITVLLDQGTPPSPQGSSSASVGVDGRRYKILFETSLPVVNVSWNDAPSAQQYSVQLSGPGGTRTQNGPSPSFSFPSGSVRLGVHQVFIETIGPSQRRSRTSTIARASCPEQEQDWCHKISFRALSTGPDVSGLGLLRFPACVDRFCVCYPGAYLFRNCSLSRLGRCCADRCRHRDFWD